MKLHRTSSLQAVKYHLIQWYELDTNIEYLNSVERVQMKTLYASLKSLNENEIGFLARKYRRSKRLNDVDAADLEGVSLNVYRQKRIRTETKLKESVVKNQELYRNELTEAIDLVYGK